MAMDKRSRKANFCNAFDLLHYSQSMFKLHLDALRKLGRGGLFWTQSSRAGQRDDYLCSFMDNRVLFSRKIILDMVKLAASTVGDNQVLTLKVGNDTPPSPILKSKNK